MRISNVHIKGFRSLSDVEVVIENRPEKNYTCLIGLNNSGKSSFLHALHILFDKDRNPCESDICKVDGYSGDTFVEATLRECGNHDLAIDDKIVVRRICRGGSWIWEVRGNVPKAETLKNVRDGNFTNQWC